jgi:hypothetical protein
MERHEIIDAMTELKLYGMRASFDEIAGKSLIRRDVAERFSAPLEAGGSARAVGRPHRQILTISYRRSLSSGGAGPARRGSKKFRDAHHEHIFDCPKSA